MQDGTQLIETSSSVSQQGLSLPTPSMQNQIHELAKTLPPPRKQNTACDACRTRKVKCVRLPGQEKCQHCNAKNYPCTHHAQQATSERQRTATGQRKPRTLSTTQATSPISGPWNESPTSSSATIPTEPLTYLTITNRTPARHLLEFLFATPGSHPSDPHLTHRPRPSPEWDHFVTRLEEDEFRIEFAQDLVEVFFQIVHTRLPLLNPVQFRARFSQCLASSHCPEPLHPALIATVIAWGAKFSEHALLSVDRQRSPNGQSHLATSLIYRAREMAEAMKVHREPRHDHVVIALLIEPLQSQTPDDPNGFQGFWLTSAVRLLLGLQINHKSVMSEIKDSESRGTMIFAWWMACLADAFSSAYYRRKPMLDEDDYDIDFYTAEPVPPEDTLSPRPSPREQYEFLGYYRASHALARIARQISRNFWRPSTESDGITFEMLSSYTTSLLEWREQYLTQVGVPSDFQENWDFVSAVSACGSDATYHTMWIVLFNALDDFGIKEVNEVVRMGGTPAVMPNYQQIEGIKHKVLDEALRGAMRIAALAGVLTTNGYLRLDPAVMHVSCIQSGTLLARLGRPEVKECIKALQQYSTAYEETAEAAIQLERIFKGVVFDGDLELNHMASVAPPLPAEAQAMNGQSHGLRQVMSMANGSVNGNGFELQYV